MQVRTEAQAFALPQLREGLATARLSGGVGGLPQSVGHIQLCLDSSLPAVMFLVRTHALSASQRHITQLVVSQFTG